MNGTKRQLRHSPGVRDAGTQVARRHDLGSRTLAPTAGRLLELQSRAGNRAVAGLVSRLGAQDELERPSYVQSADSSPEAAPQADKSVLTSPPLAQDETVQKAFHNDPPLRASAPLDAIIRLQVALVRAGYPMPKSVQIDAECNASGDGKWGGETTATVRQFQTEHGVRPVGGWEAGHKTLGALDDWLAEHDICKKEPPPPPPDDRVIVRVANAQRIDALRAAGVQLAIHRERVNQDNPTILEGPIIFNSRVTTAIEKWLKLPMGFPGYVAFLDTAIAALHKNQETHVSGDNTQIVVRRGPGCHPTDPVNPYAHAFPGGPVTVCDPWFDANSQCRAEVLAHEVFHVNGLAKVSTDGHHYGAETPAEALDCPHHLTELAFEIATGQALECFKPGKIDVTKP